MLRTFSLLFLLFLLHARALSAIADDCEAFYQDDSIEGGGELREGCRPPPRVSDEHMVRWAHPLDRLAELQHAQDVFTAHKRWQEQQLALGNVESLDYLVFKVPGQGHGNRKGKAKAN